MRLAALALTLLASSALAQRVPQHRRFMQPAARKAGSSAAVVPYSFCNQFAAGDKAGTWGCVNGDLTTGSGSSLTFSGVGSPTTTAGTTCASPSKATFSATKWVASNTTTFPTGAWSICALYDLTGMADPYSVWSFGDSANHYAMTQETASGFWVQYASTGSINTSEPAFALLFTCLVSTPSTSTIYMNAVQGAGASTTFTDPGSAAWLFGSDSLITGYRFAGPFLGGFVTEKVLSGADIARLYAAVTCS